MCDEPSPWVYHYEEATYQRDLLLEWIKHLEGCKVCREVGYEMCCDGGKDIRKKAMDGLKD